MISDIRLFLVIYEIITTRNTLELLRYVQTQEGFNNTLSYTEYLIYF